MCGLSYIFGISFLARFGTITRMQMRMIIGFIVLFTSSLSWGGEASDVQVFQDVEGYVAGNFPAGVPAVKTVWPNGALRAQLHEVLGHNPALRFKYWGADGKTVWVLNEVGKDRPITAGVSIRNGQIEDIQVLVFRESRGWEVKYDFFTRQFTNLWLKDTSRLSGDIDNITGATLSVKAMKRMATAALLLHEHSTQGTSSLANAR